MSERALALSSVFFSRKLKDATGLEEMFQVIQSHVVGSAAALVERDTPLVGHPVVVEPGRVGNLEGRVLEPPVLGLGAVDEERRERFARSDAAPKPRDPLRSARANADSLITGRLVSPSRV